MARPRILFIYPWQDTTFIRKDELILSRRFELRTLHFRRTLAFYRELTSILTRREVDLVYLWFLVPDYAPLALALSRRAGIPLVLVTGGYDVASIPAIRFGNMRKPHLRIPARWVLNHADLILPFSRWASGELTRWTTPRGRQVALYPGINAGFFTPPPTRTPRHGVVTVGTINPLFNVQKGLLTFARASKLLADVPFQLIGKIGDPRAANELRRAGGPNLKITGRRVSDDELLEAYRGASVYAQLSAHEGFGIAVAEAMACGARPVVCAGTASPEVIGNCGEIAEFGDVQGSAAAIRRALQAGDEARAQGRQRVIDMFSEERREHELLPLLESLLNPNRTAC